MIRTTTSPGDDPDPEEPPPGEFPDLGPLLEEFNASRPDLLSAIEQPGLDAALEEINARWKDAFAAFEPSDLDRLVAEANASTEEALRRMEELYPADAMAKLLESMPSREELDEMVHRVAREREDLLASLLDQGMAFPVPVKEEPWPEPDPSLTARDAAVWMQQQVETQGVLYQETAVHHIRRHFGARFTYFNRNGNPAISVDVLNEFLRLTRSTVVWDWHERYWRKRTPGDPPGRRVE